MGKITRVTVSRIAVVFDFDETLTPKDSFAALLEDCGLDVDEFKDRVQALVEQGWEKYLARAYCLVETSKQRERKITQSKLAEVGQNIDLYQETDQLFSRLQQKIHQIDEDIELEFYLISGGFVDIPRNTPIAKDFRRMWGCEFHYGESGEIDFIKKQMTHTEKTRYLYYISQGIQAAENEKDLIYNYQGSNTEDLYVPLDQVIYVGDGASDVPCFDVMGQYGGMSIGIYGKGHSAKDWEHLESINQAQKLSNLVPAGYEEESELLRSLYLCVECIAKRIALRKLREKGE
ncbi:MAG: hypothetical protein WBB01_07955 [Phormidesmis sp.]